MDYDRFNYTNSDYMNRYKEILRQIHGVKNSKTTPHLESSVTPVKSKQIGGDHYQKMAITPTEYITKNKLDWNEGNVIKYVSRHRYKGGKEDILKAIHYLELLLEEYNV